ncbi:hypothetical protein TVAGG3_0903820 [Trichomonas vaginalis G3]|uniref:hypothetical protein n=1 Tax=Trichomonas vaginalis (strain ATCC PRA-98 / G3) TaxID=412133 RepID=UPI0021E5FF54|nr:hypothetical protein TVAGG3_0903820 [Trichomonas vaginalis G3]KAI5483895.1 hypothetical protein TVAGG3_0903820 [Trichomonas vaginalis G3]
MSTNLSQMIRQAEKFMGQMENTLSEMQSKIRNGTISTEDFSQINKSNLVSLEKLITDMSRSCISRSDYILLTLNKMESEIRTVDGLMLAAKGKVGASIVKDYIKRQRIPDKIQYTPAMEIDQPPAIDYGNISHNSKPGECINFDLFDSIGIPFVEHITDDIPDAVLITTKPKEYWAERQDFFKQN